MKRPFFAALALVLLWPALASAQQKLGYVDAQFLLEQLPEYADAQQRIDRMARDWQEEIEEMQRDVDASFRDYQARELLFTQEERQRRRDAIIQEEERVEQFRRQKFGPEGELFQQQEALMRPIQERVLAAVDAVAEAEDYDFVFDKSGDLLFLYARDSHDLTDLVLEELGIRLDEQ